MYLCGGALQIFGKRCKFAIMNQLEVRRLAPQLDILVYDLKFETGYTPRSVAQCRSVVMSLLQYIYLCMQKS